MENALINYVHYARGRPTSSVEGRVSADRGVRDTENAVRVNIYGPAPRHPQAIEGRISEIIVKQVGAQDQDLHTIAPKQPPAVVTGAVGRDCGAFDGRIAGGLQEESAA